MLFYDPGYYFSHPWEILKVWKGGMAFHGGLIGASIGIVLFARRYRAPVLTVMDLASLVAPIGIFLVRIANFIKPELWGRPTDVPWAIIFPGRRTRFPAIPAKSMKRCSRGSRSS